MKIKGTKIATATTLEKLNGYLNQYYCSTISISDDLQAYNKRGLITNVKIENYRGGFTAYHPI